MIEEYNKSGSKAQIWKKKIHKKFKDKCFFCSLPNSERFPRLDAHHIKFINESNDWFDENNGLLLCKDCHIKLHQIISALDKKRRKINDPVPRIERDKKIRDLHKKKHLSYRALANIFHISQTRVMQIVNREVDK